jgi:hypothetical protein
VKLARGSIFCAWFQQNVSSFFDVALCDFFSFYSHRNLHQFLK